MRRAIEGPEQTSVSNINSAVFNRDLISLANLKGGGEKFTKGRKPQGAPSECITGPIMPPSPKHPR